MAETSHNGSTKKPAETGYEPSGVHQRAVVWFAVGLAACVVAIMAGLWWWQVRAAPGEPPAEVQFDMDQPLQPSPGHAAAPWEDLVTLRAAQEKSLHAYGTLSNDGTHARIPIERAMDVLLQSGALTQPWPEPAAQPYQFQTVPPPRVAPSVRNRT